VQTVCLFVLLRNVPCVMVVEKNSLSLTYCDVQVGNMRRMKAKYVPVRNLQREFKRLKTKMNYVEGTAPT
jgi:hypothetical protein